jgi:leucyl aminopeptidase
MTAWTQLQIETTTEAAAANLALGGDKAGQWLDLAGDPRTLVLGVDATAGGQSWIEAGGWLFDAMTALRLDSVRLPAFEDRTALEDFLLGAVLHSFQLEQNRAKPRPGFRPARLILSEGAADAVAGALLRAEAINQARAWVEQPANKLNPKTFAEESRSLEAHGVWVRVIETAELEALGANLLVGVGRGAEHGARLVVAEWRGDPDRAGWDAVLVGKGLTFDGGGVNIKSRPVIEKMKFDMGGAAAVLGALKLAASRKARCNVAVVVPMAENAIDALAYRPGDVITSLSGLTVEVVNTDAEGRLVLADALTFAIDAYAPAYVVDVATLTGAITAVLHEEFAGYYASDDGLSAALQQASAATGEQLWRLPLVASQDYLVDSDVADVCNFGFGGFLGTGGGSPAAGAKFLQRFVGEARWAHIDIAGTAWASRRNALTGKGATGFGVRLLDQWLASLEQ